MSIYININEERELFFPFTTDSDCVDLLFKNNLTKRFYEISLLKEYQTNRGFSAKVIVTGHEEEPYYECDETYNTTTLNLSTGDYTVTGEDSDGIVRIVMLHIVNPQRKETYTTDNQNIVYNG